LGFLAFLIASLALAAGIWTRMDQDTPRPAWQRFAAIQILWASILVGTNWILVALRCLEAKALLACTLVFGVVGMRLLWKRFTGASLGFRRLMVDPVICLVAGVLGLVSIYLFLRGSVAFVAEFDAVSYHLPKAVEVLKARTIPFIPSNDFRLPYFPWNYELLLADSMILTGGDRWAFLVSYLGTCGFCAAAYAAWRQAWPDLSTREAALGLLFLAGVPVLLMHADGYKNDTLFGFFLMAALHQLGAWVQGRERVNLVLAFLAFALGFGTKPSALFLGPVFAVTFALHRRPLLEMLPTGAGRRVVLAIGAVGVLLMLGGAWPILNWIWCGHPLGDTASVGGVSGFESAAVPRYNGWSNLWRFPILVLLRPFGASDDAVWVFWDRSYWFWPRYRSIYGHWGWLTTALLAAVPLGFYLHRTRRAQGEFRSWITWATLGFTALTLMQQYRVDGMFNGYPRYLLVVPVIVALWSIPPVLAVARARLRPNLLWAVAILLSANLIYCATDYFVNDGTKPMETILTYLRNPAARVSAGASRYVDEQARMNETVAFDSGFGGMVYPIYGRGFTRRVVYIPVKKGQPVVIPKDVRWVVWDRNWNVGWSRPGVTSTRDLWKPVNPRPTEEDRMVFDLLSKDPEFVLLYHDPEGAEAVFLRGRPARKPSS